MEPVHVGTDSTLYCGDAQTVLPLLPSASVDVCLCDPPYPCIDRSYGRWTEAEWFVLMRAVVPEVMRVLKPSGSAVFILQPNSERVGRMRTWLWEFMTWVGKEYGIVQDAWWWNTAAIPGGGEGNRRGFLRPSLKACVWVGNPECFRDRLMVLWTETQANVAARLANRAGLNYYPGGVQVNHGTMYAASERNGGVTPFNVLPVPNTNSTNSAGAHGHGAGTPLALCLWWCRYLCPPGGTVLDCFAGSGTVGLAAIRHGARFIGIEQNAEYVEIARKRLTEATEQAATPLFADQSHVAPDAVPDAVPTLFDDLTEDAAS